MKKILYMSIVLYMTSFVMAGEMPQKKESISEVLIDKVSSTNNTMSYSALLLLRHVRLSDTVVKNLEVLYKKETDKIKKLFLADLFLSHAIAAYEDDFIRLFPKEGKAQSEVISTTYNSEYIHIISPLFMTLVTLADEHPEALSKLLATLKIADASYAEILQEKVLDLYKRKPKYVEEIAKKEHIDLEQIGIKP